MLSFNYYAVTYYKFGIIEQVPSFNTINDTKIKLINVDRDKAYRQKNIDQCLSLCTSEGLLGCGSKFCSSGFIFVYRGI